MLNETVVNNHFSDTGMTGVKVAEINKYLNSVRIIMVLGGGILVVCLNKSGCIN